MRKSNIIDYKNPSQNLVTDVLSQFLRESAQKMLQLGIEEEVQNFISSYQDKLLINGSRQVVRNGYLPERNIQTGIGEVAVKVPRVRDRGKEDIKFSSNLIPQYMRRTVTIDVLLPVLYLKAILIRILLIALNLYWGSRSKNLSPNVISRLKSEWYSQYLLSQRDELSKKKYVT